MIRTPRRRGLYRALFHTCPTLPRHSIAAACAPLLAPCGHFYTTAGQLHPPAHIPTLRGFLRARFLTYAGGTTAAPRRAYRAPTAGGVRFLTSTTGGRVLPT